MKNGMNRWLLFLLVGLLSACSEKAAHQADSTVVEPESDDGFNILVFGDSGYQLDYLERKYFESPFETAEDYIADDRAGWIAKNKPPEGYREPLLEFEERSGSYMPASGQLIVADSMTEYCAEAGCDFGVMLGDNIYPDGATLAADGVDDAQRFEDLLWAPYKELAALREDFRIYATLGNHDWHTSRDGALAQLNYMRQHPVLYMTGFFYNVIPPGTDGEVELFVVDTEMLLTTTPLKNAILNADGSEKEHDDYRTPRASAVPRTEAERSMVSWFEQALSNSDARYKIVLAHHPFWSAGGEKFEQARSIRRLIRPAVCQYADAYLAGHEHTMEVYLDSCSDLGVEREKPVLQLVSGAAGKQRDIPSNYVAQQDKAYPERQTLFAEGRLFGFASMRLQADELQVRLFRTELDGERTEIFSYAL